MFLSSSRQIGTHCLIGIGVRSNEMRACKSIAQMQSCIKINVVPLFCHVLFLIIQVWYMKIQSSQYIRMDGVFSDSSFRSKHFICSWEWFQLNLGLRAAGGPAARPARGVRWQHHQQTTNQVPSASNWPCRALNQALLPQIKLLLQIDLTKNRIELLLPWIDLNEPRIKLLFPGTDLTKSRIQLSLHRTSLSSLESASPPLNRAPLGL